MVGFGRRRSSVGIMLVLLAANAAPAETDRYLCPRGRAYSHFTEARVLLQRGYPDQAREAYENSLHFFELVGEPPERDPALEGLLEDHRPTAPQGR